MSEASVMIVEDEVIVAEDLRRNLEASGYKVAGQAMDGPEAVHMARRLQPDVVLMDIFLRGINEGIQTARVIRSMIDTSIIYVSGHTSESLVADAVRSGAFGYIIKPFQPRQITSAIEIALHRRTETSRLEQLVQAEHAAPVDTSTGDLRPHAALRRLQAMVGDEQLWSALTTKAAAPTVPTFRITARECEVVRWLVSYRRMARVAEALGISVNTARKHLKSVFRKLGVHSQEELFAFLLDRPWTSTVPSSRSR